MANTYNFDAALNTTHISANLGMYEAARSGFFTLIVDDLDNIVKASFNGDPANAAASDKIANAQEYLKLNVTKSSVPQFSVKKHEYRRGNNVVTFAGVPEYESGTVVVKDVVGLDTKSILMAWLNLAYNVHTRKGGRMKDYKKNCTLIEYTQDYEQVREWTLHGCWISKLNEDDFDVENDGPRQISCSLEYDWAEMNLPD